MLVGVGFSDLKKKKFRGCLGFDFLFFGSSPGQIFFPSGSSLGEAKVGGNFGQKNSQGPWCVPSPILQIPAGNSRFGFGVLGSRLRGVGLGRCSQNSQPHQGIPFPPPPLKFPFWVNL